MPKSTILTISSPSEVRCKKDVLWLEIAVTMPDWCAALSAPEIPQRQAHASCGAERAGRRNQLGEIAPFQQIHGQEKAAVFQLPEIEDIDHVGMLDTTRAHGLALKPHHHVGLDEYFGLQDLEGDLFLDGLLDGAVDDCPSPLRRAG